MNINRRELIQLFATSPVAGVDKLSTIEEPKGTLRGLVFTVNPNIASDAEVCDRTPKVCQEFLLKAGLGHIPFIILSGMDVKEIHE